MKYNLQLLTEHLPVFPSKRNLFWSLCDEEQWKKTLILEDDGDSIDDNYDLMFLTEISLEFIMALVFCMSSGRF